MSGSYSDALVFFGPKHLSPDGPIWEGKLVASTEMRQKAELRDYLAAERTLLAWTRTGLALMGFGFVVACFGLFLQQLQAIQHPASTQAYGKSL
jgi:uncharacterized membrane protein YidH (DUF202 family)